MDFSTVVCTSCTIKYDDDKPGQTRIEHGAEQYSKTTGMESRCIYRKRPVWNHKGTRDGIATVRNLAERSI